MARAQDSTACSDAGRPYQQSHDCQLFSNGKVGRASIRSIPQGLPPVVASLSSDDVGHFCGSAVNRQNCHAGLVERELDIVRRSI